MIKKISIILGIFGAVVLVTVLGYTVWRIMQPQLTVTMPKAAGKSFEPARRAKPLPPQSSINQTSKVAGANTAKVLAATSVPADGHYISDIYLKELFVNNGGTNVVGYTSGFTYTDGSCDWTVINPNAVPITNNQFSFNYNGFIVSGTFDSSGSVTTTEQFVNYTSSDCGNGTTGSTGNTIVMSLSTCSQAGYASCGGSSCVNVAGDSQNCGSCRNVCTSNQHCSGGFCVAGTVAGNGQCVAPSQTHLACGANNTCVRKLGAGSNQGGCTTTGASCGGTTCSGTTPDLCGTTCTNKQTDVNNCGACGTTCTTGKVCSAGVCTLSCSGTSPDLCGSACTNKQTDINNCGACGNVCNATHGTATCSSSACGITCSSGYGNCDSNAANGCEVSLNTTSNCGACGNVCATGKVCSAGVCTLSCSGTSPDLCGTACTNKQTDSANCGTCGTVCSSTQTCTSGVCTTTGSGEANVCWGNGGVGTNAGRCYDCNGDGTVNILDFSCFRLNWLKPVQ